MFICSSSTSSERETEQFLITPYRLHFYVPQADEINVNIEERNARACNYHIRRKVHRLFHSIRTGKRKETREKEFSFSH